MDKELRPIPKKAAGQSASRPWLYAIQLALNAAWPPIFFGAHELGWALVEIIARWLAILVTALGFFHVSGFNPRHRGASPGLRHGDGTARQPLCSLPMRGPFPPHSTRDPALQTGKTGR